MSVTKKSGYLPSLDGWRAIAVLGVMMVHDYAYPIPIKHAAAIQGMGGYGLHLFFAISGVLICSRILEEEERLGRFDLRGFYLRRLLRIQPAALVYLAFAALAPLAGISHEGWQSWFGAVFFYRNYLPHDVGAAPYFASGHFWTLSVEEHFYIILSLVLYFFKKSRLYVMAVLVLMSFAWPVFEARMGWFNRSLADHMTQDTLQYLIWPAFLAVVLRIPYYERLVSTYLRPWAVSLAAAILLWVNHHYLQMLHPFGHYGSIGLEKALPTDISIVIVLFPFWIISTMSHGACLSTRFLELRPLRFVGRLSYSLYLWHVVFFVVRFGPSPRSRNPMPHMISHAPWNYLAAFACALLSYYMIEKPFMRLGHRLAPPATPGRVDLLEVSPAQSS